MMWSVNYTGTPDAIERALRAYEGSLSGHSLAEFRKALPVLEALVNLNPNRSSNMSLNAVCPEPTNGVPSSITVIFMQSNAMHVR